MYVNNKIMDFFFIMIIVIYDICGGDFSRFQVKYWIIVMFDA